MKSSLSVILIALICTTVYSEKTVDNFPPEKTFGVSFGISNNLLVTSSYGSLFTLVYKKHFGRQLKIGVSIDKINLNYHYGVNGIFNFYPFLKKEIYNPLQPVLGFGPSLRYDNEEVFEQNSQTSKEYHNVRPGIILEGGAEFFIRNYFSLHCNYSFRGEVPLSFTKNSLEIDEFFDINNGVKAGFTFFFVK